MWFANGQANELVNPFLNIFDKFFSPSMCPGANFIRPFDTNNSMIEMSNQGTLLHLDTEFTLKEKETRQMTQENDSLFPY